MKKNKKKILGILGGMGPVATADFFKEIVNRTKAFKDWDHLHIIIDNNVSIPSRTRAVLLNEESPVNAMVKSAMLLQQAGCDCIAVPCNSAHFFYDEVMKLIDIPWINMIETVSEELSQFRKILILGGYITVEKKIYNRFLKSNSYMDKEDNDLVSELIEKIKIIGDYQILKKELLNLIHKKYLDIDCVLLACSELPIAFSEGPYNGFEIVSANRIYIEKLIKICKG